MSGLILPNQWTRQPQTPVQIDWSNPLTQGLIGVINAGAPVATRVGTVPFVATAQGIGHNANGSSYLVTNATRPVGSAATIFHLGNLIQNTAGVGGHTGGIGTTSSGTQLFIIQNNNTGTTKPRALIRLVDAGGASTAESATLGAGVSSTAIEPWAATYAGTAASLTLYRNGVDDTGGRANTAASGAATELNRVSLGGVDRGTDSFSPSGQINLLSLAWDRALSAAEIKALSANPWQIFKSQSRRIFVASAGGDVSLSITGQSLTANLGALSASVTSSVTGNQTTLQQGTITANVSQTLTGQAISLVQGSVSSDVSTVITGQTVSLAQGSVTDASSGNVTKALSGQSLSVSQGALTASISLALNGQSIVLSGGSVSPAISSALAGQQASVQQGNVSANISAGLTGQAAVISNGTVFQAGSDVTKALTGQQLSIALGVLLEKKTIARPSSDTTAGAWLPSAGSSLYATLDEVSPDDADYIYTNSVSTCKIALNAVADPLTSSGQIVSYRVWSPNSNGLTVRLMQGATEIASWTHTVLPTSPTTYQQTLTAGQCDAITDYSTLAIQLESV